MSGRTSAKDFAAALLSSTTERDLAELVSEEVSRSISTTGLSFVPYKPEPLTEADIFAWNSDFEMRADMLIPIILEASMLLPVEEIFESEDRCGDMEQFCKRHGQVGAAFYEGAFTSVSAEHQILALFGSRESALAYMAVVRPERKPRFTKTERARLAAIRDKAQPVLGALRAADGSDELLRGSLAQGLPIATILFDTRGRIRWLSDEARITFDSFTRLPLNVCVCRRHDALTDLRRLVLGLFDDPSRIDDAGAYEQAHLRPGEHLTLRYLPSSRTGGGAHVMASILPAGSAPSFDMVVNHLRQMGLTRREEEIAKLAGEGYTVLNIATSLQLSENTVKTHLKHIYKKLQIGSRAELAGMIHRHP